MMRLYRVRLWRYALMCLWCWLRHGDRFQYLGTWTCVKCVKPMTNEVLRVLHKDDAP